MAVGKGYMPESISVQEFCNQWIIKTVSGRFLRFWGVRKGSLEAPRATEISSTFRSEIKTHLPKRDTWDLR